MNGNYNWATQKAHTLFWQKHSPYLVSPFSATFIHLIKFKLGGNIKNNLKSVENSKSLLVRGEWRWRWIKLAILALSLFFLLPKPGSILPSPSAIHTLLCVYILIVYVLITVINEMNLRLCMYMIVYMIIIVF